MIRSRGRWSSPRPTGAATRASPCATRVAHARLALGEAELRSKFIDCLSYGGYQGDAVAFFERINSMERAPAPL